MPRRPPRGPAPPLLGASTPEHLELLRALRAGKTTLPGLAIDTDLEWELLAGLAQCGGATPSDIAEALSTDNTSNGQQATHEFDRKQ